MSDLFDSLGANLPRALSSNVSISTDAVIIEDVLPYQAAERIDVYLGLVAEAARAMGMTVDVVREPKLDLGPWGVSYEWDGLDRTAVNVLNASLVTDYALIVVIDEDIMTVETDLEQGSLPVNITIIAHDRNVTLREHVSRVNGSVIVVRTTSGNTTVAVGAGSQLGISHQGRPIRTMLRMGMSTSSRDPRVTCMVAHATDTTTGLAREGPIIFEGRR